MGFGKFINEESQVRFHAQYGPLIDEIFHLQKLYNENEKSSIGSTLDLHAKVVHFLMNTVWDDFMEILLLFANNYPLGARKILRAMFESTTHLLVFAKKPDEIDRFVEFAWIDEGKLVALDSTYYTAGAIEEIAKRSADVKKRFQQPVCEYCRIEGCRDCAKTRTAGTWMGKVDIVS